MTTEIRGGNFFSDEYDRPADCESCDDSGTVEMDGYVYACPECRPSEGARTIKC